MADYNKFTVVQIRELFKSRNIPATGLTRKQQLIDRLLEEDAKEGEADDAAQGADDTPVVDEEAPNAGDDGQDLESNVAEHIKPPLPSESNNDDAQEVNATSPITATKAHDDTQPATQGTIVSDAMLVDGANATLEMPVPIKEPSVSDIPNDEPRPAPLPTTISPAPDESRKRKRKSVTPSQSEQHVTQKKAKQEEDEAPLVLKKDEVLNGAQDDQGTEIEMKDEPEGFAEAPSKKEESALLASSEPLVEDERPAHETKALTKQSNAHPLSALATSVDASIGSKLDSPVEPEKLPAGREKRFKELVAGRAEPTWQTNMDGNDDEMKELQEREVAPALHPATSALYIRDFMRPLRPDALESHLTALAQPPKRQRDAEQPASEEIIRKFHLDTIRTHCFVDFTSVSAASRVRSAIHDQVWPPEGNRKTLWADFIPVDKVQGWIDTEVNTGRGADAKRWQVVYERLDDGTVTTSLQEANAAPLGPRRSTNPAANIASPLAPSPSAPVPHVHQESSARNGSAQQQQQPASFVALDSLFKSTNAKPKLYYMPVSKEKADKRFSELEALTSKQNVIPPGGSGYPDSRRYTFEHDDKLVDNGPEFGLRNVRPAPRQFRGRW